MSATSHRQPRFHGRRAHRILFGVLAAVLAALFVFPGEALAHAQLQSTDPTPGQVVDTSPAAITLTFSEPVEISLGGIRLFNGSGNAVEIGTPKHPSGKDDAVTVTLPKLGNGSYVVDWAVVSADSHPVRGAYTFQVGPTSDLQPGTLTAIVQRDHTSRSAVIGLGITRGVIIGSIAIVFGGLIAVGWGIVEATRRIRGVVAGAAIAGAVAGLLQLPLEVGYATGRPLSVLFESSAWSAAFDSRIGTAWVVRAAIVAIVGAALLITVADCRRWWWRVIAVAALLATAVSSAYGGHGATGRWIPVGVAATTVHVTAMAVWLGGLTVLLLEFRSLRAAGARRFSAIALGAIGLIVASGVVQAIRQLGSIDALRTTTYGTYLIWKLMFVAVLVVVASGSRRIVHRTDVDGTRLGRAIAIEGFLALAIIVSTSLLMASNPSEVSASKPFTVTLIDGDYLASITAEPGRTGPNELHVYLSNAVSSLSEPDEVHVDISDPSRDVAPIDIPVTRSGAGHFTTPTALFPYPATWTITITARYNEFDEVQFTAKIPIR